MTKDRNFKRVVRARMAESGERYTAAKQALERIPTGHRRRDDASYADPFRQAISLGHHWAGAEHFLLALLVDDGVGRRALEQCGLTYATTAAAVASYAETHQPPIPPSGSPAGGVSSAPSYHLVEGHAAGLALGAGLLSHDSGHLLAALLWPDDGPVDYVLRELGTSRAVALAAAIEHGARLGRMTTLPRPAPNSFLEPAERQARRLGHSVIAVDHAVLAVLDGHPDGLAATVMTGCGVDPSRWPARYTTRGDNPNPSPRTSEALAAAEGLAVAHGEPVGSAHLIVSLLWLDVSGAFARALRDQGVDPPAVAGALRSAGVALPRRSLPDTGASWPPPGERLYFDRRQLDAVVGALDAELRPGSFIWHETYGITWVAAPAGTGLRQILDGTLGPWRSIVFEVIDLAREIALDLGHPYLGPDEVLLALVHPDCGGRSREVLEWLGLEFGDVRQAFVDSMGDPYGRSGREPVLDPFGLFQSFDELEFGGQAPDAEHVLLALTEQWGTRPLLALLDERGLGAGAVRAVTEAAIAGQDLDATGIARPDLGPWPRHDCPANLDLALSPLGHDPWRRRPWGSVLFAPDGGAVRQRLGEAPPSQFRIDRDGYPVLLTDGRAVGVAFDPRGAEDARPEGRSRRRTDRGPA